MMPKILAVFLFLVASAMADDSIVDISATFAPKDGAPITGEAPRVLLSNAMTMIPVEVPGGLRLVEISPQEEKPDGPLTQLSIVVRDPGTILAGTPGTTGSIPSMALAIAQVLVKLENDKNIVFLKTPTGTWSIKVSSVSKPDPK